MIMTMKTLVMMATMIHNDDHVQAQESINMINS